MSLPTPNTRKEQYLNAIATGNSGGLPTPITREEEYLDAIAKSGGGGSGEGDMKKSVYDSDLAVANAGGIGAFVGDAISGKVDKVTGKGLSTNDYSDTEKGKVADNTSAIGATQDMISDAYDSSHTYNVGDYCIHENALYKCNTASTTGTWDSLKWDAVTVAEELGKLTIRKEQIVPLIGNNTQFPERQFYITDDNTFIEFHFCISIDLSTTTESDVNIFDIPTFAQNKVAQYSVGSESSADTSPHLIVNAPTQIIWVGGFVASEGNFLCGSLRYSLI